MTTAAPFTSLRLVQLDHLIENATEEAYKDLQNIASSFPNQTDDAKKRALLQHLNATKQRLHRLQVLLQWCHKASAVAECKRVLEVASTHADAFREAADQLVYLHGELIHSKAPVYDVPTAIHVLSSGGYAALPNIIESELKLIAPGKGKHAAPAPKGASSQATTSTPQQLEKSKFALKRLDFLIRSKFLEEGLPAGMRVDRISNGEAVVSSSSKQYIAIISLVPAPSTKVTLAKWTPSEETLGGEQQQHDQEIAQPLKQEEEEVDNKGGVDSGGEKEEDERIVKIEAMDIDSNVENTTTPKRLYSEASLWRWRLLSFHLLPTHPPALLPPHLVPWLTRNIEDRMWAASDIQQLIQLGKADLVVVPPPPMTINQRKKKQKEIDDKGRQGLLPTSLPRSQLPGSQLFGSQFFGSLPYGSPLPVGTMSGVSDQITTTTGGDGTAAAEAGAPGVIPIWAQSPLAALHAVLQHVSAKIAIGSVLMEEAKAMEKGSASGTKSATTAAATPTPSSTPTARKTAAAAPPSGDSGWSSGNLRISKLDERFGVRFSLWPRVPLLSTPELATISDSDGGSSKIRKEKEKDVRKKERKYHHPSLGWILQVEVPPPTYELENKIKTVGIEEEVTKQEAVEKKESTSDGTITCVCVPPLRNAVSLEEMTLSVWSEDGSLSTENLLLRASAQHAQVQLTALQSLLMTQQKASEAQHAHDLDEVLGVDTWKVDVVDTQTASYAMPALQCSFNAHAMLLLHFRLTDGQPILSLGPLLTESGVECASEARNLVKKAQIKLNKQLDAVLTEVVPVDTTRSVLWLSTILEAVVEAWKHLAALQRKELVSIEALGYGFGRATLPRCLEGVELDMNSAGGALATKETTVALRAPYFTSATLSPPLKDWIPMGKQGSLVCYLLADVSPATAVTSSKIFAKLLRLALCWATPGGVPTNLRRLVHVPVEMLVSTSDDAKKKNQKGGAGAGSGGKATKRKRDGDEDGDGDEEETAPAADFPVLQAINWTQLKQWCLENIAVHQLEAQLEAAGCKAQPTEDKNAVRVLLATIPWLTSSSSTTTPSSTLFEFTDEEVQFSLDLERLSHPEEGAFIATFIGKKISFWKNELAEKLGLELFIGNDDDEEGAAAISFEKDKIIARCMLQNGKYSAAQLIAKTACVEATTSTAINIAATATKNNQQQEEGRYSTSIQSVDLDTVRLKHRDSRSSGSSGEISICLHWRAAAATTAKPVNNNISSDGGGSVGPSPVRSPGIRRLMIGSQASQRFENTQTLEGNAAAMNTTVVCSIRSSPQLPAPLLSYLGRQLSAENNFDVGTFLSVVTSVGANAAVVQAVVLDPVAQHAAGLLPGAIIVENFSFEAATKTAAAAVSAAVVGVCTLLVRQLGRSLQLQMVFQSSGAVMLRARQLPPTAEQQGGNGGVGEVAWLQEAWSRIALQNNIATTSSGNRPEEWRHIYVTLLPEQLGTVLTSLLCAVGQKLK